MTTVCAWPTDGGRNRTRLAAAAAVLTTAAAAGADVAYIALGDSVGFGITTTASYTQVSDGDRGYVSRYADWLAQGSGGIRPRVVNLSIFGDSTSEYFDTSNPARQYNSNYDPAAPPMSQSARFAQAAAAELAAGNTVSTVSVSIGANDALGVWSTLGFILAPYEEQVAITDALIATAATNLGTIFGQVRSTLPDAELVAVGYYDPFPALPDHPLSPIAAYAMPRFNQVLADAAGAAGGRYVEVYSAFAGREGELTYLTLEEPQGFNVHPTELGYEVIAGRMIVPGPGGVAVAISLAGWAGARPRRRR